MMSNLRFFLRRLRIAGIAVFSFLLIPVAVAANPAWVLKVFDGDTILVEGLDKAYGSPATIRLAGIDSPEKAGRDGQPGQPFADRSKAYLSSLVQRKSVRIDPVGLDPYGRTLGVVYRDGENINLKMLRSGMAEVYRGKLPEAIPRADYFAAEGQARSEKIGIWRLGGRYESPYHWKRRHRHP